MDEFTFPIGKKWMYVRHSAIHPDRPTVLCIHGIGESGLSFREFAAELADRSMNVVVPDLLGYGRSSGAEEIEAYEFTSQIRYLWQLLDCLDVCSVAIVGHSMGGDIGTLMCEAKPERVTAFLNLEGNLTESDTFICSKAVQEDKDGHFRDWLQTEFAGEPKSEAVARYYASVRFAREEAFLRNAQEMYDLNRDKPDPTPMRIGTTYATLPECIPKLYGWGSLNDSTKAFLIDRDLDNQEFEGASHWIMVEQSKAVAATLQKVLR